MWVRNCPECGRKIAYRNQSNYCRGNRTNSKCRWCAHDGQLIGRIQRPEEKERRAASCRGKVRNIASRKRYSISKRGTKNPQYGNHAPKSSEHRRKIRVGCIKALEERLRLAGKPLHPVFNPSACQAIEKYGRENGYTFQHALNGGEYFIKDLGYWVDGYDHKRNAVIEYYERTHNRASRKEKDARRQQEILDFLGCEFIILQENGEVIRVSKRICR